LPGLPPDRNESRNRQTLGGRDPAKGGLVKAKSNEATLKKMRGYGGAMFYDK